MLETEENPAVMIVAGIGQQLGLDMSVMSIPPERVLQNPARMRYAIKFMLQTQDKRLSYLQKQVLEALLEGSQS